MQLTRVEASTMSEALTKIRATLGDEAKIVGTRTFRRGGVLGVGGREMVEVYVAREHGRPIATAPPRDETPPPPVGHGVSEGLARLAHMRLAARPTQMDREANAATNTVNLRRPGETADGGASEHPFLREARQCLLGLDIEPRLVERLVWELRTAQLPIGASDPQRLRALLKEQIKKLFLPAVPTALERDRGHVQVFVGPTGVGKTTTVAKLAARARINERRRVGLITLDTFRIAAVDQLQKYARIIGIELEVVSDPVAFRSTLRRLRHAGLDVILVDTAGRGHRDELKMRELEEFLSMVDDAEVHLVLSTTTEARTLGRIAARFVPLGVHRLILTKLDEAESFGSLLGELATIAKPVSYLTDGQNVPDDIQVSDPDRLASLVLRGAQI